MQGGTSSSLYMSNIFYGEGARFLINKNMQGILNVLLDEISDFKQMNLFKIKSISILGHLIRTSGMEIPPDAFTRTNGILSNLFRYIDSDVDISRKCEEVAQAIGEFTDQNIIIPILVKQLSEIELLSNYQPLYVRIKLIANTLSTIQNIKEENAEMLLNAIKQLDIFGLNETSYTKNILFYSFKLFNGLVSSLGTHCAKFHESLFFPLLILQSLPDSLPFHQDVRDTIAKLSTSCNFNSIEDLYCLELGCVLEKFRGTHKTWRRNSPDRFAFDTYVRNAGSALEKHWTDVLLIISQCSEIEKDIEMRMDMIILVDEIVGNKDLFEQISNYMEFILPEIVIPATAWRSNRPNYKIRKAAMVCLIKIFKNSLVDIQTTFNFFKELMLSLKSALEDDWDPELRFLSLQLLKSMLVVCKMSFTYDHMLEMYPHILKRLDDSQDTNRILTCEIMIIFFEICKNVKISESIYEYIISNSFIHLDDPNENVRNAVAAYLQSACTIHTDTFLKIAEKNEMSFTHKSILRELTEYAKTQVFS